MPDVLRRTACTVASSLSLVFRVRSTGVWQSMIAFRNVGICARKVLKACDGECVVRVRLTISTNNDKSRLSEHRTTQDATKTKCLYVVDELARNLRFVVSGFRFSTWPQLFAEGMRV